MQGEKSEQELQDEFMKLFGRFKQGKPTERILQKTDRLQYLWNTSYPHGFHGEVPKEIDFSIRAKQEGFTNKQIDAFLNLP